MQTAKTLITVSINFDPTQENEFYQKPYSCR